MAASSSSASGGLDVSYRPALDKLHAYEKAVCRIVQKGDDGGVTLCGTGFLIGPTLVMTCNHVVPDLETAKKCQAQFFKDPVYHPDLIERSTHTYDQLEFDTSDPDKFLFSPQNKDEKENVREAIEGKLDYSILFLKAHPAFARRQYFQLFQSITPKEGRLTYLYQHPEKDSIDVSTGLKVRGDFAMGAGNIVKVGEHEVHYMTPTEKGGSGGPVVDASGNLIALHYQGDIADSEGHEPYYSAHECSRPSGHTFCNAGVRLDKIVESLGEVGKAQIKAWIEEGNAYYRSLAASSSSAAASSSSAAATQDPQGSNSVLPVIDSHALLRHFTGRRQALTDLHARCTEKQRVVLSGLGGIGKTTLALKYLKDHEEEYDLTHFMPAGDKALITAGLLSLANKLGIPKGKDNERLERLKAYLDQTPAKVLLVFDGVDHPDSFEYLQTLLPEKGKCLLITSRLPSYAKKIGFTPLDLKPFTPDEAVDFLLSATPDTNREQAALLAETLGRLPLALTHAAAYIRETPGLNFEEYNKRFKERSLELFEKKALEGILSAEEKTILTTWDMSLKTIREHHKSPLSMDVMHFFSCLAHAPIPINIVAEWFKTFVNPSQIEFDTATRLLQSYSLITNSPGFYNIHMLVQQVTRYKASEESHQKHLKEALKVFHSVVGECNPERPEVREFLAPFIPHCEGICSPLEKESLPNEEAPLVHLLLNRIWGFCQHGGKYQEALSYVQRDQKITKGQYGNRSTEWATSLSSVGMTLEALGKYEEALIYLKEALELRREFFGSRHSDVAMSLNNVGMALQYLGKHEEALVYLKEALKLSRELLGSKHPDVASSLNNVGMTLKALGKHEKALIHLKEALELFRELLGSKHPHVALSLNNVGTTLQTLGKHEEALVYKKEALELRRELLGSKHPDVASSLNNVGMTLQDLGKHEEALVYLKEALELFRELLDSKHPDVATSLNNVGSALQVLGKHEEALIYKKEALKLSRELLGSKHPDVATSLNNVGSALQDLGKHEEALVYLKEALELRRELLGSKHPHVATSLNNVGSALQALGKHEEALIYQKEALELTRELLGSKHPDVALSLSNVGMALQALGKHEEALIYQKEALELYRELLGSKHPDVALSLSNVGGALQSLGKHEEALVYLKEALELTRELLGSKHPHVAGSLNNLGLALKTLGKHEEALVYLKEALELARELLGSKHPHVAKSLNNVGSALQDLGKHEEALKHLQEAVEMSEASLGLYHPNTLAFYRNLAECLQALKRDEEAKVYQQKAIMGMFSSQLPGNPIFGAQLRQALQEEMDQFFRNWTPHEDSPGMGSSTVTSSSQSSVGSDSMLSQTAPVASSSQSSEASMRQVLQPAIAGFFPAPTSPGGGSSAIASSSSSSQTDLTTKLAEITSEIEAFERDPFRATKEKREVLIQKIMELASSGLDPRVLHALCERVFRLPQNSSGASSSSAGS